MLIHFLLTTTIYLGAPIEVPVIDATVQDSDGAIAKYEDGQYSFDIDNGDTLKYPLLVEGGFLDLNGNGKRERNEPAVKKGDKIVVHIQYTSPVTNEIHNVKKLILH